MTGPIGRRQLIVLVAAGGVALAGTVAAVLEAWVVAVVCVLALGGLVSVIGAVSHRRIGDTGRQIRQVHRQVRDLAGTVDHVGSDVARLAAAVERNTRLLEELGVRTVEADEQTRDSLERLRYEPTVEMDALHQLQRRFPFEGRVPLVWGWALSPGALLQTLDLVEDVGARTVVECGSGLSTLYLARVMKDRGGRVIALEHTADFAEETREMLRRHGLADVAEVRDAALVEVDLAGAPVTWYEPAAIDDIADVDLLLVDGPPKATGDLARYPAVPLLATRLSPGCAIVLDDAHRGEERAVAARWLAEFPQLSRSRSSTRYQAVLRWSEGAGPGR